MGFASKIAASQNQMRTGDAPGGVPASLQAGNSDAPPGGTPYPASAQTSQGKPAAYGQSYPQQGPPPPAGSPYPQGPPGPVGARPPGPPGPPGPPRPPGAQYGPPGGAAPATPQQVASYRQLLISTIQEKQLQHFYPQDKLESLVQSLAADAPAKLNKLMHEWNVSIEIAMDVIKLSLFDVILYVDDSGSIEFEEGGIRKDQLRQIITTVATAASTFDQDGISVRFMNSVEVGDGIRSADDVNKLVSRVRFQGLTPLGTNLRNKVLDPLVVGPARSGRLQKPILIITITDGQPAGEPRDAVAEVIRYSSEEVSRTPYGRGAVSFQFSQVGNDTRAREFLASLDEDPRIGGLIDCTSNFEVEQDEMSRANPPVYLTRELWCAKLMLGAIDSSYDTKDEKAAGRAGGAAPPPPSQYGGYSQAPSYSQPGGQHGYPSYGQPAGQPGYGQGYGGAPPQTNYGQAYGGYGAQSYQPSYPAYGGAPAGGQGGYPPQQQQQPPYGAPPAPPRY